VTNVMQKAECQSSSIIFLQVSQRVAATCITVELYN